MNILANFFYSWMIDILVENYSRMNNYTLKKIIVK